MAQIKMMQTVWDTIVEHARRETPIEACGYIGEKDGVLVEAYPLKNIDMSGEHFTFDPKEQFAAVKTMREKMQKASVVYHSHPETPSRPSDEDKRLAYDQSISYVIISLAEKEPVVKSFRILEQQKVEAEEIVIV